MQAVGIHYMDINSAANNWLVVEYAHETFGAEIDAAYPLIRYTSPYRDSHFTLVELVADPRTMVVEGAESQFVGKSPLELVTA